VRDRVALLSLKAAYCGITLTAAHTVVFAELYWTPGICIQAEDRVHRIGQAASVNVQYLVGRGTIDEILWRMLGKKAGGKSAWLSRENVRYESFYYGGMAPARTIPGRC
jgi:SWI/SNF-related matrix-associated actin-dependent regulator 1 of chromatin subfamily A